MQIWERLVWTGVLVVCLVAGIAWAWWSVPEPVVAVVHFDAFIDSNSAGALNDVLEAARRDSRIAGVVLGVDSPGGIVGSIESIYYTMLRLRAEKPIVVYVDSLAVSGGYYMAAAANAIYAAPSANIGNIGTRGPRPGDPFLSPDEVSTGPYKLSGGSRFDSIYQIDLATEAFANNVMAQRLNAPNPLTLDKRTVREARVYLGSEAVAVGLVDYLGTRSDAILTAAELAQVSSYKVVDLVDYLGLNKSAPTPPVPNVPPSSSAAVLQNKLTVQEWAETIPADAVLLLDSRIDLPRRSEPSVVEQHMLELRRVAPASLDSIERWRAAATPTPDAAPQTEGAGS